MSARRPTARGNRRASAVAAACLCAIPGAAAQPLAPEGSAQLPSPQTSQQPGEPSVQSPFTPYQVPPPAAPPSIAAPGSGPEEGAGQAADLPPPVRRLPPAGLITSAEGGPVILGEHAGEWKGWDLRTFKASLDFLAEIHDDKQTSTTQPNITQRSTLLRGTTNISFEGAIGHRNFIDLQGNFSLGYEDQAINGTAGDEHTSAPTDYYDITATVLSQSFAPVTAYSRRDETIQNRDFAGTLKTVTWESGAIVNFKSTDVPTRVQYFHREASSEESLGLSNSTTTQDTFTLGSSTRLGEHNSLALNYTFNHIDETSQTTFANQYDEHLASLEHAFVFGASQENTLRSAVTLHEESGLYGETRLRVDERLTLIHSPTLRSDYSLSFETLNRGGQEQRQLDGNASVSHTLFESLTSEASAGGTLTDIPGVFSSASEFVSGTLTYTKRVPLGRLGASASLSYTHQQNASQGETISVFDESHTFNDPFDVVISRRNVTGLVTVTDLAHIPKTEGADFTVTVFPDRIEIHRQPFGTIVNGQTVLVSYQVGPEPENTIDTLGQFYSLRYTFNEGLFSGLSLYTYLQISNHTIDAPDPSRFVLDDVTDLRVGGEYRLREWRLEVEHQHHESTISPYERMRYEVQYQRQFGRDATLLLSAVREEIDYQFDGNHTDYNSLRARWTQRLGKGFNANATLEFRDEHNERNGNVRGFEQSIELRWHLLQTSVYGSFHNAFLTGGDTDRVTQTIMVGVSRSF